MATPEALAKNPQGKMQGELSEELRQAEDDFARGDFIEVTVEQLDQCIAAGKWPWPDESCEYAVRFAAVLDDDEPTFSPSGGCGA